MSDVLVSFGGKVGHAGEFTNTPGIGFSSGRIEGDRADLGDLIDGSLMFMDGLGGSIEVRSLLAVEENQHEDYESSASGTVVLGLIDPRVEARFGAITLRANVLRDDRQTYDPDTLSSDGDAHTWRELVEKCFETAGVSDDWIETAATESVTWVPTDIEWDHEPPLVVMQRDLLEPIGYTLVWQINNTWEIHQVGVGEDPPDGAIEVKPLRRTHGVVTRPTKVRVVGGRRRIQEVVTSWVRCIPHDGWGASGTASSASSGASNGQIVPLNDALADWGYTTGASGWAKGVLLENQFSNYTGGASFNKQRIAKMRQWVNRFMPGSATAPAVRQKLPMLPHLLDVNEDGYAQEIRVVSSMWRARNQRGATFENLESTDRPTLKGEIVNPWKGVIEVLIDQPLGTLGTTGVPIVEDSTLVSPDLQVEFAYTLNTGTADGSDFYTMERDDPKATSADAIYARPERVKVIRQPELVVDEINGATAAAAAAAVETKASALITKIWDEPLSEDAFEVKYNGLVDVPLNGRIRRVTHSVPRNGFPQTVVQVNNDRPDTPYHPTYQAVERQLHTQSFAARGEAQATKRLGSLIQDRVRRSKSQDVTPGVGGGGREKIHGRKVHTGWISLLPLTDSTATGGRAAFCHIKTHATTGGSIGVTNEGPILRAHFITAEASDDYADEGKWIIPGYQYVKVTGVTSVDSLATYSCIAVDAGATTSTGNTLPAVPLLNKFPTVFRKAWNELASTINALIDVHSTGAALPGALGLLTSGHSTMDTGDRTLVVWDLAGDPHILPNTDFKWPT